MSGCGVIPEGPSKDSGATLDTNDTEHVGIDRLPIQQNSVGRFWSVLRARQKTLGKQDYPSHLGAASLSEVNLEVK